MNRIMVLITLSDDGIKTIISNPELPKKEMEFVNQWKQENILESFYISVSKKDAVLIFQTKLVHFGLKRNILHFSWQFDCEHFPW